jgi:hypothetical protein
MSVVYPLTPPGTRFATVSLRAVNAVVLQQSPFTFAQQVQAWPGQSWMLDVSVASEAGSSAEAWAAFLVALRGSFGTFLMGDPARKIPWGSAGGTPQVNGAGQLGDTLAIGGATPSQTGWLRAGDYVQLGSGPAARMHKVLLDADSDALGNVSLSLWPGIRTAPSDGSAVVVNDPVGLWRLASNVAEWQISSARRYGIQFSAVEVVP